TVRLTRIAESSSARLEIRCVDPERARMGDVVGSVAVHDENARRSRLLDRAKKGRPSGVVGEAEAAVETAHAGPAGPSHPTRCEARLSATESAVPALPMVSRRSEDQLAGERAPRRHARQGLGRKELDPGGAIALVDRIDVGMDEHAPIGEPPERREHALSLPERVRVEDARSTGALAVLPPCEDLADRIAGLPLEVSAREGRLRDEGVAEHRLEGLATGIALPLVVARDDPHLARVLDAHLRGAEHVSGGKERHADGAELDGLAELERTKSRPRRHAMRDEADPASRRDVLSGAALEVIAGRVRDHGTIDGAARSDTHAAGLAIKPVRRPTDEALVHHRGGSLPFLHRLECRLFGQRGPSRERARIE